MTRAALTLRRDRPRPLRRLPAAHCGGAGGRPLPGVRPGWRDLRRHPAAASRSPTGGGWADTVLTLPAWALARRALRARSRSGGVRLADLLVDLPVALLVEGGPVTRGRFEVWAPLPERVQLSVGDRRASRCGATTTAGGARTGRSPDERGDYGFVLDDGAGTAPGPAIATPAARRARALPHVRPDAARVDRPGVDRPPARRVGDLRAARRHVHARGHLDAAIGRLDHLVDLGVDLVELMPVNAFNGTHNWGYDGVLWYAVHEAYGGPAAYRRFVDALPRRRARRHPGRRLQPPRPVGQLPARVRAVPARRRGTRGAERQPRRPRQREVRRYILDNARMWLRGLPRRRTAPGCRARPQRRRRARTSWRRSRSSVPTLSGASAAGR